MMLRKILQKVRNANLYNKILYVSVVEYYNTQLSFEFSVTQTGIWIDLLVQDPNYLQWKDGTNFSQNHYTLQTDPMVIRNQPETEFYFRYTGYKIIYDSRQAQLLYALCQASIYPLNHSN